MPQHRTLTLFPQAPDNATTSDTALRPSAPAGARVLMLMPNRTQIELPEVDLESLLPEGHRARVIWAYVQHADLSGIYAGVKAVEGGCGRTPIAPEILLALWLFATVQGVGSARAIARFTEEHDAYRWICGGVSVNYHTLSDFRADHGAVLDELLTDSVAVLVAAKAVTLKRVAQDGSGCGPAREPPRSGGGAAWSNTWQTPAPKWQRSNVRSRPIPRP
jgi:transposase